MTDRAAYRRLQRRLDTLPIGYPRSPTGSDIRLLKRMFDPEGALVASELDWRFSSPEAVAERVRAAGLRVDRPVPEILRDLARRGAVLYREAANEYALLPLVVGMYEFQVGTMTREYVDDAFSYMKDAFGLEFLASGEQQSRVIPIGESVRAEHRIATYDEFRSLIRDAGDRIAVLPCVCRRAKDLLGEPCKRSDRRELCIAFRDYADTVVREGWGRAITTDEALELAELNQKDGFVLRPSNEREPQFLCACCDDCCGLLAIIKFAKRPADYVATNFRSRIDPETCVGCGLCAKKCPMDAIDRLPAAKGSPRRPYRVQAERCIGCGVCVPACRKDAIALERKETVHEPARTTEELMERLAAGRPNPVSRLWRGIKAIAGIPVRRGPTRYT
jgi:Pyruvate/2-oxoacid:ferredoxin oxidoreductase delta subunit